MSGQNTSSAVMAQRVEPPDSLDYFPTPPWATRALIEHVIVPDLCPAGDVYTASVWEPACGEGHMARPLAEYFTPSTHPTCTTIRPPIPNSKRSLTS